MGSSARLEQEESAGEGREDLCVRRGRGVLGGRGFGGSVGAVGRRGRGNVDYCAGAHALCAHIAGGGIIAIIADGVVVDVHGTAADAIRSRVRGADIAVVDADGRRVRADKGVALRLAEGLGEAARRAVLVGLSGVAAVGAVGAREARRRRVGRGRDRGLRGGASADSSCAHIVLGVIGTIVARGGVGHAGRGAADAIHGHALGTLVAGVGAAGRRVRADGRIALRVAGGLDEAAGSAVLVGLSGVAGVGAREAGRVGAVGDYRGRGRGTRADSRRAHIGLGGIVAIIALGAFGHVGRGAADAIHGLARGTSVASVVAGGRRVRADGRIALRVAGGLDEAAGRAVLVGLSGVAGVGAREAGRVGAVAGYRGRGRGTRARSRRAYISLGGIVAIVARGAVDHVGRGGADALRGHALGTLVAGVGAAGRRVRADGPIALRVAGGPVEAAGRAVLVGL